MSLFQKILGIRILMDAKDTLTVQIKDKNFDFSDFFDQCDQYGRSRRLGVKEINMIQLMIEEVVVNHLLKHANDVEFTISCIKDSSQVEVSFTYDGRAYNLYTEEPADSLSIVIIKCLTRKCIHEYDRENRLYILMQLGVGEEIEIIQK